MTEYVDSLQFNDWKRIVANNDAGKHDDDSCDGKCG
jgi:hypothetical protein